MSLQQVDPPSRSGGGGMSKLAQLAQKRALQNNTTSNVDQSESNDESDITPVKPVSKLSALARARASKASNNSKSLETDGSNKSIAILDRLRSSTNTSAPPTMNSTPLASLLTSKREGLSIRSNLTKKVNPIRLSPPSPPPPKTQNIMVSDNVTTKEEDTSVQLTYDVSLDNSIISTNPVNSISSFLFKRKLSSSEHLETEDIEQDQINSKRRRQDQLFYPITNFEIQNLEKLEKVKQNFTQLSPDDKILQAQHNAFNDNFQNLKVTKPTSTGTTTPPKSASKSSKSLNIESELASNKTYAKPHKSFVVIGHVDAGKSTLMGRMLLDYGIVDAKTVDKLVKESMRVGKGSFALAWILDQTEEERSHGVTVDICATDFETSTTRFTAIDAPGHKDFVPQMIGGLSQADLGLLVVDSIQGEFESGFAMDGQTKEHTILAKNLGIEKLCIAINKLDKEDWSEDRFNHIKSELTEYLTSDEVQFTSDQLDFIPISGLTGNNVVKRDSTIASFSWYKGPTLGEYLETIKLSTNLDSKQLIDEEFFLTVSDSYKDKGELKVTGKVISGIIQSGDSIISLPSEVKLPIQSLYVANKKMDFAINGEVVQLTFKASQVSNDNVDPFRIGDLVAKADIVGGGSIKSLKKFTVSLHLFNMDKPLLVGMPFVLFRNNCQVPARITKLIEVTSAQGKKKKKNLLHLVSKQTAIVEVEIEGSSSLPLTKYTDNKTLGRIVIRREGATIGAGTVVDY